MTCKICGRPTSHESTGAGYSLGMIICPLCKCGHIRSRERAKGCPKCGKKASHTSPTINIELKQRRLGGTYYLLTCDCGHTWRVRA